MNRMQEAQTDIDARRRILPYAQTLTQCCRKSFLMKNHLYSIGT